MERTQRPVLVCARCIRQHVSRRLLNYTQHRLDAQVESSTATEPSTSTRSIPSASTEGQDATVIAKTTRPAGSRRRRALISQIGGKNITFEQMPYQCFQEARKVLQEDRQEKLIEIEARRARIERLKAQKTAPQDERMKEIRLRSLRKALEELKIHADINDPLIKRKFEDGQGDLSKPIYRFMADRKWREYKRKILMQRIEQMNVVPDVLPSIDPTVSTEVSFGARKVQHGEIIDSGISEKPPTISIQPFDQGTRLITIAFINPDVPNVEKDSFDYRCHFLACNVPVSPTTTSVNLARLDKETQLLQSWYPPYAQKGLGYQRLAVCIFEQPTRNGASDSTNTRSQTLDVAAMKQNGKDTQRSLTARALVTRHRLTPVGIDLFRTKHDENTADVMKRAGIAGADVEFKRKRIDPLPYKRMSANRYR